MNSTALALIEYLLGITTVPPPNVEAAVSIVAVANYESGLNPGPQAGNTGGVLAPHAYGAFSDNGARQQTLKTFALAHGWNGQGVIPLDIQVLNYLNEMANSYPEVWAAYQQVQAGTMDYTGFIPILVQKDEIPAAQNVQLEINGALAFAASWLASGQITAPSPTPPSPPAPPAPPVPPTPAPPSMATILAEIDDAVAVLKLAAASPQVADALAILQTLQAKIGAA